MAINLKTIIISIIAVLIGWSIAQIYPLERLNPNFREAVYFKNDVVISPEESDFYGKIYRGSKCKQIWAKGFYHALSCTFLVKTENIIESKKIII